MKFNYLTLLYVVLVNALCILANPVAENSTNDLQKRNILEDLIGIAGGDVYDCLKDGNKYGGYWTCCKFDCMREPSKACRNTCFASKGLGCNNGC